MRPLEVPELVDRIIDHLHNDKPTLRATSLVAWPWVATSQHHLLQTCNCVSSANADGTGVLLRLLNDIHASQRLAASILALQIVSLVFRDFGAVCSVVHLTQDLHYLQDLSLIGARFSRATEDAMPLLLGRERLRLLVITADHYCDGAYVIALLRAFPAIQNLHMEPSNPMPSWPTAFPHAKLSQGVLIDRLTVAGKLLRKVHSPTSLLLKSSQKALLDN